MVRGADGAQRSAEALQSSDDIIRIMPLSAAIFLPRVCRCSRAADCTTLDLLNASDHYATLGLTRDCTAADIRIAYRDLAKRPHPDLNGNSRAARIRTQAINAAYEILRDPAKQRAYDHELDRASRSTARRSGAKIERNVTEEVRVFVCRAPDRWQAGSCNYA